jgi:hypothetical protein
MGPRYSPFPERMLDMYTVYSRKRRAREVEGLEDFCLPQKVNRLNEWVLTNQPAPMPPELNQVRGRLSLRALVLRDSSDDHGFKPSWRFMYYYSLTFSPNL